MLRQSSLKEKEKKENKFIDKGRVRVHQTHLSTLSSSLIFHHTPVPSCGSRFVVFSLRAVAMVTGDSTRRFSFAILGTRLFISRHWLPAIFHRLCLFSTLYRLQPLDQTTGRPGGLLRLEHTSGKPAICPCVLGGKLFLSFLTGFFFFFHSQAFLIVCEAFGVWSQQDSHITPTFH